MPACPRDNQYSNAPPPGFTDGTVTLKRGQLIELLEKVIDKCQHDPQFLAQQPKQIDLLVSVAQLTLLSTPVSSEDKRQFLNHIVTIGQDLLTDENNIEIPSSLDSCPPSNENNTTTLTVLPSDTTNNNADDGFSLDDLASEYLRNEPTPPSLNDKPPTPNESKKIDLPDGDFSLDDLANEYLQNEPTPSSLNDKPTTSSESEEPDLSFDERGRNDLSSSPSTPATSVLSALVFPLPSTEPIRIKPPLESILFSNRLSSQDAADDADGICKEESSPFGQMFCTKTDEIQTITIKRISTCLFDRALYERLTRLIALLPKQCIRNSVQQLSIRPNEQQPHRPPRSNQEYRRPSNRPSFQQNSSQSYAMPRYPATPNPRHYSNTGYSNPNGYSVNRRSQQQSNRYPPPPFAPYPADQQYPQNRYPPPPPFAPYPTDQQYQQNRYPPPPPFAPYPTDQQYQQKGPPRNNSYNNNGQQQQKKKPQTNNQQASNQQQQQRGTKKGASGGGNKPNNEKPGANSNPK